MQKLVSISEMQKFYFGGKIICTDGEGGTLTDLIFDPATRRLTALGVKQGRFFGKTVYLPFAKVVKASGDGITVDMKRDDVASAEHTPPGGTQLSGKSEVVRTGGNKGSLRMVAVHPDSGQLAYVVARNLQQGQDTLIRNEYVSGIAENQITLSLSDESLNKLPPYRPDDELQQDVESVLFDLTPMHIDMKGIRVRVLDGVLYLDGNISSALRADIAQDQVLGVPGILEIKNNLVADDRLAADLAMALAQDQRTRELPIGVYPRLGVVRLSGAVHNAQQKAAAEEIVRKFPGVQGVENYLVIDPKAEMLHVMAPPEGGESEDLVPGKYIRHTQ
ncbi:MAG TPA: BON domain-containing protein [Ktedonobacteraceae bacterium]|jgi:osmotically-inducible protein OsmY|nr:BON domain-containing protein [Ktedonobacteraceae bacterium]